MSKDAVITFLSPLFPILIDGPLTAWNTYEEKVAPDLRLDLGPLARACVVRDAALGRWNRAAKEACIPTMPYVEVKTINQLRYLHVEGSEGCAGIRCNKLDDDFTLRVADTFQQQALFEDMSLPSMPWCNQPAQHLIVGYTVRKTELGDTIDKIVLTCQRGESLVWHHVLYNSVDEFPRGAIAPLPPTSPLKGRAKRDNGNQDSTNLIG